MGEPSIADGLVLSPARLSRLAQSLYPQATGVGGVLIRGRPLICPLDMVIRRIGRASRVLDVGCGNGLLLGLLAALGLVESGVGFDPNSRALQSARAMAASPFTQGCGLRFVGGGVGDSWPAGPFDVVTMVDVMHHLPPADRPSVVARVSGALGPHGRLIYKDMCMSPRWRRAANRLHDALLARQWTSETPIPQIIEWASRHGLILVSQERINRLWYGHDLLVFEKRRIDDTDDG